MSIRNLLGQTSEWLRGTGPNADIVMSSRIRLARNLDALAFSHWASKRQEREVLTRSEAAFAASKILKGSILIHMNDISDLDKQFLLERHLVSREQIVRPEFKAVAISDREMISIMVNEEDHLRSQVMQSGFALQEGWRIANQLDNELSVTLPFAFDPHWGYLTACPTNTGTGMRASVMLHLPALVMTKQVNRVIQAITKLGMVVRGLYGEGTDAEGNLFQVSNQITLGQSEPETIDHIERIIRQIIGHEENARKQLIKQNRELLYDKIWRALGVLKNAYIITSKETIHHLSMVRLGADLGVLPEFGRKDVNELFILTQPAHLQRMDGKLLSQSERDIKRALLIRQKLGGN
ncbi:MAG: protein arginine kinase [Candidatus Omnitrophica bacterium]|nr:protein arginine kinase [Candidatus Omnitrophota bacterium]